MTDRIIKNKKFHWLINVGIWFLIFTAVPPLFQYGLYSALPFDYFVKIHSLVVEDYTECQRGDNCSDLFYVFSMVVNRTTRFDIRATSKKEVYEIFEDGRIKQVYEIPIREFTYEADVNGRDIHFSQPVIELPEGNYYISDNVNLYLPRGIVKSKTIKTDSFIIN